MDEPEGLSDSTPPATETTNTATGKTDKDPLSVGDLVLKIPEPEWVVCPGCKEERMFLQPSGFCMRCDEADLAAYQRRMRELNKPREAKDKLLAMLGEKGYAEYDLRLFRRNVGNADAFMAASKFNPDTDNLYIHGRTGVGKSHLAGAIVRAAVERGLNGIFINSPELMRRFRGKTEDEEEVLLDYFSNIPVLAFDELGIGRATEFSNQILYEIVSLREKKRRNGLVITSNMGFSGISEKMGEDRLASRLNGMCLKIRIDDIDHRDKNQEATKC